jgi:mannonate dehydratase
LVGATVGLRYGLPRMVRPGRSRPLGAEARALVERCFEGLDPTRMWDTHVHIVGLGAGDTGCWIDPQMQSQLHPVKRFQFEMYTSSLGMSDPETADADYVARLLELHRGSVPAGKLVIMALDQYVDEQGVERPELSPLFTPNDYVLRLAAEHPEFVPCVSIHPYRLDAVERLDAAAEAGARAVKWLPNATGLDPASPRCDAFYRRLAELRLPLITHGGRELAVDARDAQELGNPLRLRRPLDAGVRVVVAHCASFGSSDDTDLPESARRRLRLFDLFMRLFTDPQYESNLFGDISALTVVNRDRRVLRELLSATELHARLVNGSDYPIPALTFIYSTEKLRLTGLLGGEERRLCREIAEFNPLLFDFVLKRVLRHESDGQVYRFSDSVFQTDRLFS